MNSWERLGTKDRGRDSEMRQKVTNRLIFAVYFTFLLAFIMIPTVPSRAIHKITVIVRDSFGFTPNQLYYTEGTYNVSLGGLRGSFGVVSGEFYEAKPVGGA